MTAQTTAYLLGMCMISVCVGLLIPSNVDLINTSKNSLGYVRNTGSMEPFIYEDSKYMYRTINIEEPLKCGHLYVVQQTNKSNYLHRFVYETREGLLVFKGDNNQYSDEPVTRAEVLREVTGIRYDLE